jgi:tetratricopeptide (TPR) repeat protein
MSIVHQLSVIALHHLVGGACQALKIPIAAEAANEVFGFLAERFTDHGNKLTGALETANQRAWTALELALSGESWWDRARVLLSRAEEKNLARQVQTFLSSATLPTPEGKVDFPKQCLTELRAARAAKLLAGKPAAMPALKDAADFARYGPQRYRLEAEGRALTEIGTELQSAGYPSLSWLVRQRPQEGSPLLAIMVAYFFRRELESNAELFNGLMWEQMQAAGQAQEAGLAALSDALSQHGDRLEHLLADVQTVAVEARDGVLRVEAVLHEQSAQLGKIDTVDSKLARLELVVAHLPEQLQQLGREIHEVLEPKQLSRREVRPQDSLSLRTDEEHRLVRALLRRCRSVPTEERQRAPALVNAMGKLEVLAGEFANAQNDFQEVTGLVSDPGAQAEAHFNAYHAAQERRDWDGALRHLLDASRLANERFSPFPLEKYAPERILGAGGFGVAFLCRHRFMDGLIVVKSLRVDDHCRRAEDVFAEAQALRRLDHPGIIRIHDCGFADGPARCRPYVVMDYFEAVTLESYVAQHGPLPPADLLAIATQTASALQAAHGQRILHRDVKPANLLVRKTATSWDVKLIDFGLALLQEVVIQTDTVRPSRTESPSGWAGSVGTLDYAAPEQFGRRPGETVGPPADVYGFGKTACFALFGTPQPSFQHWRQLPEALAELLGKCVMEAPKERPSDFGTVLRSLAEVTTRFQAPRPIEVRKVESPKRAVHVERPKAVPVKDVIAVVPVVAEPKVVKPPVGARQVVRAPALAMVTIGILGLLFNLGTACYGFVDGFVTPLNSKHDNRQEMASAMTPWQANQYYQATGNAPPTMNRRPSQSTNDQASSAMAVLFLLGCSAASVLAIGAGFSMLTLRRYWLCLIGSMAVMPAGCLCCLAGMPVGLWSLTTLWNSEVHSAFS